MSPTALPGLVSELARDVLAGPARPARVIAVARQALYLLPHGQRDPLALVVPGAARVPTAVVLPRAAGDRPFHGLTPGRTGRVGAGRIAIGSLCLTAGEFWAPPRAQDSPPGPVLDRLATLRPPRPLPPEVRPVARALVRMLAHGGTAARRHRGPAARGPRPARPRPRRDTLRGRLPVRAAARRPGAAAPAGLARGTRTYRGRGGQADAAGLRGPSPVDRRRPVHPSGRGAAAGRRYRWRPVRPGHRPARRRPQFGVRPAARSVRGSASGDPRPRRGQAPIHTVVMTQNPLTPRSDGSCPDPDRSASPKGPAAEADHHPHRTDHGAAARPRRPRPPPPSHPPAVTATQRDHRFLDRAIRWTVLPPEWRRKPLGRTRGARTWVILYSGPGVDGRGPEPGGRGEARRRVPGRQSRSEPTGRAAPTRMRTG